MTARIPLSLSRIYAVALLTCVLPGTPVYARSQESGSSDPVYRLTFTLRETIGETKRSRSYEMTIREGEEGRLRVLSKVPLVKGEDVEYVDMGAKIDAEFEENGEFVEVEMEMQFTRPADSEAPSRAGLPQIEEWQSRVEVPIPAGRPTIIARSATSDEGLRYELELLAEKLR